MFGRRLARRSGTAVRALVALTAVGACLGVAAYAATLPKPDRPRRSVGGPPKPRITDHPDAVSTATTARFAFAAPRQGLRFRCRLDQAQWRDCHSPLTLRGVGLGAHRFEVRAVDDRGRSGAAAEFAWRRTEVTPAPPAVAMPERDEAPPAESPPAPQPPTEAMPFSIEPRLSELGDLYPGAPAQPLPVTLSNPNSAPILVTGLRVAVSADPPGCDIAANFELIPAAISPSQPLSIPAGATLNLPAPGVSAPAIAMRDVPVDQDACEDAQLPLRFSGEASG